jgi:hypothetical protein
MEMADPSLDQLVGVVRREAFVGLLRGASVTVTHVAGERGLPRHRVRAALDQLVAAGAAELDGERIVGAHGLTARTTRHAIGLDERVLQTWCGSRSRSASTQPPPPRARPAAPGLLFLCVGAERHRFRSCSGFRPVPAGI